MRLLASAKSVAAIGTDTIFIIRQRPWHTIAFVQPFQQVAILASLTTKRLGFRHYRLSAERALISFARHGHDHSLRLFHLQPPPYPRPQGEQPPRAMPPILRTEVTSQHQAALSPSACQSPLTGPRRATANRLVSRPTAQRYASRTHGRGPTALAGHGRLASCHSR